MNLKKLWANDFLRGSIALTIASFIVNVLNYIFNVIIGRSLGPQGFGEMAALFSYISIISVPVTIVSTIITQKIASSENNKQIYAKTLEIYFVHILKRVWPVVILLLLTIPFISRLTNLSPLSSYLLLPLIFVSFISAFYGAVLQGLNLFSLSALVAVIAVIIKLIGGIIALTGLSEGYTMVVTFFALSMIVTLYCNKLFFSKNIPETPSLESGIERKLRNIIGSKQFVITTLSVIGLTLFSNTDIVFAKKFLTSYEAGIFSSWSLFAKVIIYVVGPLISVGLVYFSQSSKEKDQQKIFGLSISILLIIGVISFVGYRYFGSLIILFLGNKFSNLLPLLGYASIFGTFYAMVTFFNNFFLAKKSYGSLIMPASIPVYIIALFFIQKKIISVIYLDIITGAGLVILFTIYYFLSSHNKIEK